MSASNRWWRDVSGDAIDAACRAFDRATGWKRHRPVVPTLGGEPPPVEPLVFVARWGAVEIAPVPTLRVTYSDVTTRRC